MHIGEALKNYQPQKPSKQEHARLIAQFCFRINKRPSSYKKGEKIIKVRPFKIGAVGMMVKGISFEILQMLFKQCDEADKLREANYIANADKSFAREFFTALKYNKTFIEAKRLGLEKKKKPKKEKLQASLF